VRHKKHTKFFLP